MLATPSARSCRMMDDREQRRITGTVSSASSESELEGKMISKSKTDDIML